LNTQEATATEKKPGIQKRSIGKEKRRRLEDTQQKARKTRGFYRFLIRERNSRKATSRRLKQDGRRGNCETGERYMGKRKSKMQHCDKRPAGEDTKDSDKLKGPTTN